MSKVPYLSKARIQELGNERLRQIVDYAYRAVPYYQRIFHELKLRPTDIRSTEDLEKLPKISKVDVRRNPKDFISKEVDLSQCATLRTSGTIGIPTKFLYDQETLALHTAIRWRFNGLIFRASGRRLYRRGRAAFIVTPDSHLPLLLKSYQSTYPLLTRLFNVETLFLSVYDPPDKNLGVLREFKPNVLSSYGSYLEILARHVRKEPESWPSPKVVVFSGDPLTPTVRRFLENDLDCEVFGAYGATEAFLIGFECEAHRGYHLNTDVYAVSAVGKDGKPVAEGEKGEIVVSNLMNKAMVLLNYLLDDVVEWGGDCVCGRNLPTIRDVSGRIEDIVVMPDGQLISPLNVTAILYQLDGVKQYQVVQNGLNDFVIKIVADVKTDREALSQKIKLGLKKALGSEADISVSYVREIPRPGGKIIRVISKVPTPSF